MNRNAPRPEKEGLCPVTIQRYSDKGWSAEVDTLAREVPVTVTWNGGESRLWAWPFALEYLAAGHAYLEQRSLDPAARYTATVVTDSQASGDHCCQVALQPAGGPEVPPGDMQPVTATVLLAAMELFLEDARLWRATGCFHRAGIFSPGRNTMLHTAEDIGRHNCVDRLAGWALLHEKNLSQCILFLSARVTASICRKAVLAGFRCIASHSAVSSAAVAMAAENGVTLAGFIRPERKRLNLYADPGRLLY